MLADLLPLMTDTVLHWYVTTRDIHGRVTTAGHTEHRARIVHSPGKVLGSASRETMPDAAATVWLIDHPRPIAIGDTFELPDGAALKVARLERRVLPDGTLFKAYLT